jgi:SPP1 family predicted phage head-tail adaptor|nr:MAG TPA: Putative head tail adaptor [Caudoviricetes sp.]
MQAGLLKDIIEFEKRELITNEFNEQMIEYKPCLITKAQVIYSDGSRAIENDEIVVNYSPVFNIRYYHNVNETMRIKFNNQYYRIVSIQPFKQYQYKKIITELINE